MAETTETTSKSASNKAAETTKQMETEKKSKVPEYKKGPIKDEAVKEKAELSSDIAKDVTPETFTNELEKLKEVDAKDRASLLASSLMQLSYKAIAIEQIISTNEIKLFSENNSHVGYERALNTALSNGVISIGDFQTAIMYKTSSLDQFVETNSGDKKEGLETTKYVEFLIKKYALSEKGLKDKNGNINAGVINENVTHLGNREFLLAFFTSKDKSRNIEFKNDIAANYDKNVQEKVKKMNDGLPKETLDKLGIYTGDKLDKLAKNFEKDPMGTILDVVSKDGGMGMVAGIIALFFGGGFKGFMRAFVGGTALSSVGIDGTMELRKKAKNLAGDGVDKLREIGIDTKYDAAYLKILFNVKGTPKEKEDFIGIYKDLSKSESFKKIKIDDLKKANNENKLGELFKSEKGEKLIIDNKPGALYYQDNLKKINLFIPELLKLEELGDKGKTVEDLLLVKKENETPAAPEKSYASKKVEIIEKSGIEAGLAGTILTFYKDYSVETIEKALEKNSLSGLVRFQTKNDTFYNTYKEQITKISKIILETVPEKNKKISEII